MDSMKTTKFKINDYCFTLTGQFDNRMMATGMCKIENEYDFPEISANFNNGISEYLKINCKGGLTFEGNIVISEAKKGLYRGELVMSSGIYKGNFVNNMLEGRAEKSKDPNGSCFFGNFTKNKLNDLYGKITGPEGGMYCYIGGVLNNLKEGKGEIAIYDGEIDYVYDGEWSNDKPHGKGKFKVEYGNDLLYSCTGEWENGATVLDITTSQGNNNYIHDTFKRGGMIVIDLQWNIDDIKKMPQIICGKLISPKNSGQNVNNKLNEH